MIETATALDSESTSALAEADGVLQKKRKKGGDAQEAAAST